MANECKGVQQVRTMGQLVDGRRSRTSAGALLELSMLEMEKTRLNKEIQRTERRCEAIRQRMGEIEAKQNKLKRFVAEPQGGQQKEADVADFPIHNLPQDRLRRRRLSY